jgi:hypothetical protein
MKVTLTPTDRIVTIDDSGPCRIWEGTTDLGTKVFAYILALSVPAEGCNDQEMGELLEIMGVEDPKLGTAVEFHLPPETEFSNHEAPCPCDSVVSGRNVRN